VIVGDQGSLDRGADHPVVPDAGVEREQPLHDAGPQPGGDAAAVAFEAELVFQRPDDRLHALPQPVREVPGFLLVLAGRADQGQAQVVAGEEGLGLLSGQALVGDDGGAAAGAAERAVLVARLVTGPGSGVQQMRVEDLFDGPAARRQALLVVVPQVGVESGPVGRYPVGPLEGTMPTLTLAA